MFTGQKWLKQISVVLSCFIVICVISIIFVLLYVPQCQGETTLIDLPKIPLALSDGDHPKKPTPSLTLNVALPKVPEVMMVYKVKNPIIDEVWVNQFASRHLGITGEIKRSKIEFYLEDNIAGSRYTLEVDPSNGFICFENREFYELNSKIRSVGNFPTIDECKGVSMNFLTQTDLLPGDAFLKSVVDNVSGADVISICYGREINGIKFWGAGARITVDIGRGGVIARVGIAWQELIPFVEYPIKSPTEAVEELISGKGILYHGAKGDINDITFVYYASPVQQEYVQPCYYFKCLDTEKGTEFYGLVEAVKPEYCLINETLGSK